MTNNHSLNMDRGFKTRIELIAYLSLVFPAAAKRDWHIPETRGGRKAAEDLLSNIDPVAYGRTRNYLDGAVTRLSPYIRHGILSLSEVRDYGLQMSSAPKAESLIQELCWRDYWQRVYRVLGNEIWEDIESYKTGFRSSDYADQLPADILQGKTNSPCVNWMIQQLVETGYLHNRLRMYLAAYIVHWRRVRWQTGASWFLEHLLDGDPASNNLAWQWVASTFGSKPYIFNQENIDKYLPGMAVCQGNDQPFAGSYEEISDRLFPRGKGNSAQDSDLYDRLKQASFSPVQNEHQAQNPIIWIHGDCLNPNSPALQQYPHAPSLWVWDEALLDDYNISLKRILFMYESILETPAAIRRGNVYPEIIRFVEENNADGVVTMDSPSPRFTEIVRTLQQHLPVTVLYEQPIVNYQGPYDLRRFMRYWQMAKSHAFR